MKKKVIYEDSSKAVAAALSAMNLGRINLERLVLAELIHEPSIIPATSLMLKSKHFDDTYASAYEYLLELSGTGKQIDVAIMMDHMPVEVITEGTISSSFTNMERSIMSHAAALVEKTKRIAYVSKLSISLLEACGGQGDCTALISNTCEALSKIDEEGQIDFCISSVGDELEKTKEKFRAQLEGKLINKRVTTSFPSINELMYGGFNGGELIILAARPGVGKTSVMLQMAKEAAKTGNSALILSLEMTKQELVKKLLVSTPYLTVGRIVSGNFTMAQFDSASSEIGMTPMYLADRLNDMDRIIGGIRIMHSQGKCDIAYIDYLGLIHTEGKGRDFNLAQEIGERTRRLKLLAIELEIPIVVLCQLNRESAKGGTQREPQLTDLRDSGSIEQDADTVIMLERLWAEDNRIDLHIRKYRHGRTASIPLIFDNAYTTFTERDNFDVNELNI